MSGLQCLQCNSHRTCTVERHAKVLVPSECLHMIHITSTSWKSKLPHELPPQSPLARRARAEKRNAKLPRAGAKGMPPGGGNLHVKRLQALVSGRMARPGIACASSIALRLALLRCVFGHDGRACEELEAQECMCSTPSMRSPIPTRQRIPCPWRG
jgi:hypothetical protein